MSDDDSIISEEIDYRPDDESGSFHASEEHYNDAASKSKIIGRAAVKSPVLGHTGWGGNVQKSTVPSETHSNDFSEDDYSAEFEETSAQGQFSVYSNDFDEENENIVADVAVRKTNTAVECKKSIETFEQLEQPLLRLPGINIASLQAEIALEEISKEVVRLRNQQKNLLQERRHVAREKKLRAENRRAQYDLQLRNMTVELRDLKSDNEMMRSQHSSVKKSLEIVTYSNTTLEEDLRMKTKESDEIKIKVMELQSKLEEQMQLMVDKESDIQKKEAKWAEERNAFKEEILRFTLLSSVVQQSLEANELRYETKKNM
jgi:chromosome segregation ATPase